MAGVLGIVEAVQELQGKSNVQVAFGMHLEVRLFGT